MNRASQLLVLLAISYSAFGKECSEPEPVANGKFEFQDYPGWPAHIRHIVYTCESGFSLKGNPSLYCYEGEWTAFPPTCEATFCPTMDPPADGSIAFIGESSPNQMDSMALFSCHDGFQLEGQISSCCLADGTWSRQAPKCVEQYKSCKAIKESQSNAVSGMYELVSESGETFTTFCDMETSDGGWTLVASVHENDMDGKCTEGDRWSSEVGVVERHGGETLWENDEVYGTADQAASDDYKNSAYFELQAEQLMVIQVPNDKPSEEFISSASFQYTTDAFLQEFGGNLQGLFKSFPIIDGKLRDGDDDGPDFRIDFVKGSERDAFKQYGYDMQQEMQSGYMQFRAVNKEHGATAFCPYGKMKPSMFGSASAEHACFGATKADVDACGDFSAFDGIRNDMGIYNNWATDKEMRRSAFLILYR